MQMQILQLSALTKLGSMMALADGHCDDDEMNFIAKEMVSFEPSEEDMVNILTLAEKMEASDAISIVAAMDDEQKRETCAFLGAIIAQDGQVDDKEMALWSLISQLCGLPRMSLKEALEYMA